MNPNRQPIKHKSFSEEEISSLREFKILYWRADSILPKESEVASLVSEAIQTDNLIVIITILMALYRRGFPFTKWVALHSEWQKFFSTNMENLLSD